MLIKNRIISIAILVSFLFAALYLAEAGFAEQEELMHNDPRASEARVMISKGKSFMKKAEREKNWNKGRAYENYRSAEKEFGRAARAYAKIGRQYNLNVEYEIEECEALADKAARKMGKKRSTVASY